MAELTLICAGSVWDSRADKEKENQSKTDLASPRSLFLSLSAKTSVLAFYLVGVLSAAAPAATDLSLVLC